MIHFFAALLISLLLTAFILITAKHHSALSHDDFAGVQKYHKVPTPRIGGLAIYVCFLLLVLDALFFEHRGYFELGVLLSCSIIFFIGLLEDLTKKVSPLVRTVGVSVGVWVAIYLTKSLPLIHYAGFATLNILLSKYSIIAFALTLFCVLGLTNAYNIIDGYNGLAATTAVINLAALLLLASIVHDRPAMLICVVFIAATVGFLFFNYPGGKIFLGDGGAYLLGFVIAAISIHLVQVHHSMSPYSVLLINAFPVMEIGFSIYRRKLIHKTSSILPDRMHLHQLIYHRCVPRNGNRNAGVMPLMLYFIVPQIYLAIMFYKSTLLCLLSLLGYLLFYIVSYKRLLRFKTLGFLKIRLS